MSLKKFLTNLIRPVKTDEPVVEAREIVSQKQAEEPPEKSIFLRKHSEKQKMLIAELIAYGLTTVEINEELKDRGINISPELACYYKRSDKWRPIIREFRNKYLANPEDVPGYHKRIRLERAEATYERAVKKNDIKNQISSIEHQRKEVEGSGDISLVYNQYHLLSDKEIENKINQLEKEVIDAEK